MTDVVNGMASVDIPIKSWSSLKVVVVVAAIVVVAVAVAVTVAAVVGGLVETACSRGREMMYTAWTVPPSPTLALTKYSAYRPCSSESWGSGAGKESFDGSRTSFVV